MQLTLTDHFYKLASYCDTRAQQNLIWFEHTADKDYEAKAKYWKRSKLWALGAAKRANREVKLT